MKEEYQIKKLQDDVAHLMHNNNILKTEYIKLIKRIDRLEKELHDEKYKNRSA